MRTWPVVSLGDISESVDYGVTASAVQEPIGPKFLRITDIQQDRVDWDAVPWCSCTNGDANEARLRAGDIVFARTGATTGKSYLLRDCPTDSVFASYLIRVRLRADAANPTFISHFFKTPAYWAQVTQSARGVAQPGVNATSLKRIQVPLPPLPEQRRIATILDTADALRLTRLGGIEKLKELKKSIFLEMFGDPRTNPKRLAVRQLGDLIRVKSGDGLLVSQLSQSGHYPVYGGNGLNGFHTAFMFETPRITIGRVGVYCGAIHTTKPKAWVTDNALYVAEMSDTLESGYLAAALEHADLNQYAGRMAQPLISGSRIYPVSILVPPKELQRRFTGRMTAVESVQASQMRNRSALDALFASLQHRAFSGAL